MTIESVQFSCFVGLGCIPGSFYGYGALCYWLATRFTDIAGIYCEFVKKLTAASSTWEFYQLFKFKSKNLRQLSRDFPSISTAGKEDSNWCRLRGSWLEDEAFTVK